jgi:hypothetical protein
MTDEAVPRMFDFHTRFADAVDTLYFTDPVETQRGCRPLLRDGGRLLAFFGIYPGSPGREIIRVMEWRGGLSYTLSRLRKHKAAAVART